MYVKNIQYEWLQDRFSKLQARGQAHAGLEECVALTLDSADKHAKANNVSCRENKRSWSRLLRRS